MTISVKEIVSALREIFDETKVLSTDMVCEKTDDPKELKLVIFLNKVVYEKSETSSGTTILYTKLIFRVDTVKDKIEDKNLTKNMFTYLYDMNCVYKQINFDGIDDLKSQLKNIFGRNQFGKDIKSLSKFLETPTIDINEWLSKNNVKDISVYGFKYDPQIKMIPCKVLSFRFNINVSNIYDVDLSIVKEDDGVYYYNFKILDETVTLERNNLSDLSEIIAQTLKTKLSKKE